MLAAGVDVAAASTFPRARALVRDALREGGLADRLEDAVEAVLPVVSI